jgi:arginine exporter protein ArgO
MELVALVPLLIVVAFWAAAFFFAFFAFRRWMQAPTEEGEEQAEHSSIPDTAHTVAH